MTEFRCRQHHEKRHEHDNVRYPERLVDATSRRLRHKERERVPDEGPLLEGGLAHKGDPRRFGGEAGNPDSRKDEEDPGIFRA